MVGAGGSHIVVVCLGDVRYSPQIVSVFVTLRYRIMYRHHSCCRVLGLMGNLFSPGLSWQHVWLLLSTSHDLVLSMDFCFLITEVCRASPHNVDVSDSKSCTGFLVLVLCG